MEPSVGVLAQHMQGEPSARVFIQGVQGPGSQVLCLVYFTTLSQDVQHVFRYPCSDGQFPIFYSDE